MSKKVFSIFFLWNIVFLGHTSFCQTKNNRPESLGNNINTVYDEQNPVLGVDGKAIYFTRKNHPDNIGGRKDKGDIWYSILDETGEWGVAKNLGKPINNQFYNQVIGFSNDGNTMFLQNHYTIDGKPPKTQGISISHFQNGNWSFPQKVSISYFFNRSSDASMSLSYDRRIMLLSIESHDTYGGEDIYVSFLESNNTWSQPINLGNVINTKFQEMTPYLGKDNATLYFASNGHGGYGSRDIFYSKRLDNSWKKWDKPKNLGKAINTEGVELSYQLAGDEYAYLVSTQNSEGYGDIQKVKIDPDTRPDNLADLELINNYEKDIDIKDPEIPDVKIEKVDEFIILQGKVVNANSLEKPVRALLEYKEAESGATVKRVYSNDSTGLYSVRLEAEKTYLLTVSADGFLNAEERISILHTTTPSLQKYYLLTPLDVGITINLKNVLFERGTSKLLEDSYQELDKVADMLIKNPAIEIELAGHTDNQGNAKLNIELSQKRVNTVKKYLLEKGIASKRVSGKGFGGMRPISSNKNEETRKLNRRVEFTIIKN